MAYEVFPIDSQTWRIENGSVRFFLLTGSERALLVDSGATDENARGLAESLTSLPLSLINTHTDGDHTACNYQFDTVMMHPAEYPYYRKVNGNGGAITPVWDGDVIDLGGRPLQVIAMPGHTPGSIALLDENRRVLIGGDGIQDGRIFLFNPHRDLLAHLHSLKRLQNYRSRFDTVYPSHASFPVPASIIDGLISGIERVLAGEIRPTQSEFMGTPIKEYDMGTAVILYDDDIVF